MLHSVSGFEMPFNDNAYNWGPRAQALGYTVDMHPAIGSIYWSSNPVNVGHVAWVESVSADGSTVNYLDYNSGYPTNPGLWAEHTGVATSSASGYIHFKDVAGLSITSGLTITAPNGFNVNAPIGETFTVANNTSSSITAQQLILAVRDPSGANYDQNCASNLTLAAGQSYPCTFSQAWGSPGTYTIWPAWSDTGGTWHQLASNQTFTLLVTTNPTAYTLSPNPTVIPNNASGLTIGGFSAFAIGTGGDLQTNWQTSPGSGWHGWGTLHGNLKAITIVPRSNSGITSGGFAAFAIGSGGDLEYSEQTSPGSTWTNWTTYGGNFTGMTIIANNSSGLTIGGWTAFGITTSGDLQYNAQTSPGGIWNGWHSLLGNLTGTPVVVPNNDSGLNTGGFMAFAVGTGGDLQYKKQTSPGSNWTDWTSLGGSLKTLAAAVPNNNGGSTIGGFTVFAVGTGNDLQYTQQSSPGSTWNGWHSLNGNITGNAALVPNNASGLTIGGFSAFGIGSANDLQTNWQTSTGSTWHGWSSLQGSLRGTPVIVANNSAGNTIGGFTAFAIGTGNDLQYSSQTSPGSTWNGWHSLNGSLK